MRLLLIANHHARRGTEPLDAACRIFAAAGFEILQKRILRGREAPQVVRRYARDVDAIVLAGGDGTVHSAAESLIEAGLPVGLLPMGTANDLAKAVNIPFGLEAAAALIAAGATRNVDVGEANGKLFFNVAHIGLGAALASGVTAGWKKRIGPLAYSLAAAAALPGLRPFSAEISYGGERVSLRTIGITIGNGRFFGGSGIVAEDAEIDDGLLHLFALTTKNPVRLALLLPDLMRGRQGRSRWVHTLVDARFHIRTRRAMKVRADGKIIAETPAEFRLHPRALAIFAPAHSISPARPAPNEEHL